ncbi:MAG: ATP-binding protein [Cyanobacteriota bacterium]
MEQDRYTPMHKIIEVLSLKSNIAKKFSVYIFLLIAIIIFVLVFSIHSQAKVIDVNFKQSIILTTKLIGNLLANPIAGNDITFIDEFVKDLIDENDIVYIIIHYPDKTVMLSTIESYWGKDYTELSDKFSGFAAHDTRLNLRQEQDEEIKRRLYEDKKSVAKQIRELKKDFSELKYAGTLQDVEKQKIDNQTKMRILEEEIAHLKEESAKATKEKNDIVLEKLTKQMEEKRVEHSDLISIDSPLDSLRDLLERHEKKEKIIERMPSDNMIYEVSVPVGGAIKTNYGILRIGYSPKKVRKEVSNMYKNTFLFGVFCIVLGLIISLKLARTMTKPLGELAKGAEILGSGNLYHRININTDDEMELLADRFNLMAEKLNESYSSLEQKVNERTREYLDATKELQRAYRKLQKTQAQLVQSEKMTSLGQLVAGVAHELNNPIGFITSNMQPLQDSLDGLMKLINLYGNLKLSEEEQEQVNQFMEENDFEFMLEDLNDLIEDIKEGAKRAHKIVLDLRNFSRLDEAEFKEVDLHQGIDSTLNLLSKYYKHRVTVHKDYSDIPFISCYASQLNQVWMNLLVNAAQAIDGTGDVYISTSLEADKVVVKIRDTGKGIPQDVKERIFDPFYTTKPVGEGTGLGLSITHSIIEKHEGIIELESEIGKGTVFIVKLPIRKDKKDSEIMEESKDQLKTV